MKIATPSPSSSPQLRCGRTLRSSKSVAGLLALSLLALTGCQNATGLAKKLDALDALGVTHVQITGKFSDTTYDRKVEGGVMKSRLSHNNAWVPKIVVERERPAPASETR